jgi:hypothetical protein
MLGNFTHNRTFDLGFFTPSLLVCETLRSDKQMVAVNRVQCLYIFIQFSFDFHSFCVHLAFILPSFGIHFAFIWHSFCLHLAYIDGD